MTHMKKLIAMLLALLMTVAAFPFTALAVPEAPASGTSQAAGNTPVYTAGDYTYTVLEDGTASITSYTATETPTGLILGTHINLPSALDGLTVSTLAQEAFAYNSFVDTVMIPASVTRLDNAVFYRCTDLKGIAFCGDSVEVGFTVVEACSSLEKVFVLESCDLTAFCGVLLSDMGAERAEEIEILEFPTVEALLEAYNAYLAELRAPVLSLPVGQESGAPVSNGSGSMTTEEEQSTVFSLADGYTVSGNRISNDYLAFSVNASGSMSCATTGGDPNSSTDNNKRLLYGGLGSGTSKAIFYLDGSSFIFSPNSICLNEARDSMYGSKTYSNKLKIEQVVSFSYNTYTGRHDTVEIKYVATNISNSSLMVGTRIFFDTMLGNNDHAPFQIPGYGEAIREVEFSDNQVPQTWQCFDRLSNPTVISSGTFYTNLAERPDKVQFLLYGSGYRDRWNCVIQNNYFGDSAVNVYFNPITLAPGESRTVRTFYGLSQFAMDPTADSPLGLQAFVPTELTLNEESNAYEGNPFAFNGWVTSKSDEVVANVSVTLELPEGWSVGEGESLTRELGDVNPSDEINISWFLRVAPVLDDTTATYFVVLRGDGMEEVRVPYTIRLPGVEDHKVIYNSNGGSFEVAPEIDRVARLDTATVRFNHIPVRQGYTFLGWSTDEQANVPTYTADGLNTFIMGCENVVLYAVWHLNTYTLTFTANDDIVGTVDYTVLNTNVTAPDIPEKAGYVGRWSDYTGLTTALKNGTVTASYYKIPAQLDSLVALPDINCIKLSWSMATEINTAYYVVSRGVVSEDGSGLENVTSFRVYGRSNVSYIDTDVEHDVTYGYTVLAVSSDDVCGPPTGKVNAYALRDTEAPVVTKLTPDNGKFLNGVVALGMNAQDNLAVTECELFYSVDNGTTWVLLAEGADRITGARLNTVALADGILLVKAVAKDAEGNTAAPFVNTYMIDNTGIEKVTGLTSISTSVTVTLSWDDVADNDISFFRVERRNEDGSYAKVKDVSGTLGANLYGLVPNETYIYRVVGYDRVGNRGIPSDDVMVTTLLDTMAPVVTSLRPLSGYYSTAIDLSVKVEDDFAVASILIQVSLDLETWQDVYTKTYSNPSSTVTLTHGLSLETYPEGLLYVRAIAEDVGGNLSVSDATAPMVQYVVDRTAPEAPIDVVAVGHNGYVELRWDYMDNDVAHFNVYRASAADGPFTLLKSTVTSLNYYDRGAMAGITYYYCVEAVDRAGNRGEISDTVFAKSFDDTQKPVISDVYPDDGATVGAGYRSVQIWVTDNNALQQVVVEYSVNSQPYRTVATFNNILTATLYNTVTIPAEAMTHGGTVVLRLSATDMAGNEAEPVIIALVVDLEAPMVLDAVATFNGTSVDVEWSGAMEPDLAGYRVYRAEDTGGYVLIAQRASADGKCLYAAKDTQLSDLAVRYSYRIDAVDLYGNTSSYYVAPVELPDRSMPKPVISCEASMEIGVQYYVDASLSSDNGAIVSYHFDFGDGTTSTERKPVHVYNNAGTYVITLTVTDNDGHVSSCSKEVTVTERRLLGLLTVRVVDQDGRAVPNAPVYFDLAEESQIIRTTNIRGEAQFTASVGRHTIGCIIADNEWLPVKKEVVVTSGTNMTVTLTMVNHTLIEGQFEIKRMTLEEIVAAGIDISAPENQYFVSVDIHLTYEREEVRLPVYYNPITNETIGGVTKIPNSGGGDRLLIGQVINPPSFVDGEYRFSRDVAVAVLDIPVGVYSLKEFFDVKLHIINNASEAFSMLDNVVELNLPDGLTIMDTDVSESSARVTIPEIKGQSTTTINWIVRGDEVGEYAISADYSGVLSEFNVPIYATFVSEDPIVVYGLSNMKLVVEIPEKLDKGVLYYNLVLVNGGRESVYLPRIATDDILIETELLTDKGWSLLQAYSFTAKNIYDNAEYSDPGNKDIRYRLSEHVFTIDGDAGVLLPGYAMRKHYMCVDDTTYTEKTMKLKEYSVTMQNSYGLTVEFSVKPLVYFTDFLDTAVNPVDKAEQTLNEARSAYDYIMNNENFAYWQLYSDTDEFDGQLPGAGSEAVYDLLSLDLVGFLELDSKDDAIQSIILDAMELSVAQDQMALYKKVVGFLGGIYKLMDKLEIDKILGDKIDEIGKSMKPVMKLIYEERKWEIYESISCGAYMDLENNILTIWSEYYRRESYSSVQIWEETTASAYLRKLFTNKGFETVWKGIGVSLKAIPYILTACEDTMVDVSLFITAQANLDNYNLFLDSLILFTPCDEILRQTYIVLTSDEAQKLMASADTFFVQQYLRNYVGDKLFDLICGDGGRIVSCATEIKETLNKKDIVYSFVKSIVENGANKVLGKAIKEVGKKGVTFVLNMVGMSGGGVVLAVKAALGLTTFVADNVFNVKERLQIANNIRYVALMSVAFQKAVSAGQNTYLANKTESNARTYLQLLSYLIKLRAIGESQVAEVGVTYEVVPGIWDSRELFLLVRSETDCEDAHSWYEWRDAVEDRIALLGVELLRNPGGIRYTGLNAPVVTFDYKSGRTYQTFDSRYEYSINGGEWIACDGDYIYVTLSRFPSNLRVRVADPSSTDQKDTADLTVSGIPSVAHHPIAVVRSTNGYRFIGLDHETEYAFVFSNQPLIFDYSDMPSELIPAGSYSYDYETDSEYSYVYLCSLADTQSPASFISSFPIKGGYEVTVHAENGGTVSGDGRYLCGDTATLTATAEVGFTFAGWYDGDELVSTESDLTLTVTEDRTLTARFTETVYYVTFLADGVEIAKVPYTITNTAIAVPAVPAKADYTAAWSGFDLREGGDVTVEAVYTPVYLGFIHHVSLDLGRSLNLFYYASLNSHCVSAKMAFTYQDITVYVNGFRDGETGLYAFAFPHVAPDHMGEEIRAELIVLLEDGSSRTLDILDHYSIRRYCDEMLAANPTDAVLATLLADLLAYGAAAQAYTGTNTDEPVNAGFAAAPSKWQSLTITDQTLTAAPSVDTRILSAGIRFGALNKLYFKFKVSDALSTTVRVNGKTYTAADFRLDSGTTYILYSDAILATEFDKVFTVELIVDGDVVQTLTYSVRSYVKSKQNSKNTATAELARALYAYGLSAKKYLNIS